LTDVLELDADDLDVGVGVDDVFLVEEVLSDDVLIDDVLRGGVLHVVVDERFVEEGLVVVLHDVDEEEDFLDEDEEEEEEDDVRVEE
jgi:hypothetical protein